MPPTNFTNALTILYEETGGLNWTKSSNWLTGEPCIDEWYGVVCCPASTPILERQTDGSDVCVAGDVAAAVVVETPAANATSNATSRRHLQDSTVLPSGSQLNSGDNAPGYVSGARCSTQLTSGSLRTTTDLATCVVVRIELSANRLDGSLKLFMLVRGGRIEPPGSDLGI